MTFHKLVAEGGMTFAEVGAMTYPQLICRFSEKAPDSARKFTSHAAFEAAIKEQEEAWSRRP